MTARLLTSVCLYFALVSQVTLVAQPTNDSQLAEYYLSNGEYEKALLYYEKLYETNPTSSFYSKYLETLIHLEEYKDAEKLVKRHNRQYGGNSYHLDMASIYDGQGKEDEANREYHEAIEALPASQGAIIKTANDFIKLNKLQLALETYQHGRNILSGRYPFNYEIASLYGSMGDTRQMISEYLDLIKVNDAYLQTVQNALNRTLDFEDTESEDIEILREELLKRVQKDPAVTTYAEMLTWLFIQQKEFNAAFIQLRALDKRLNENGQRLLNLASLCINNDEYDVAAKCYEYLINKGEDNPYYLYAVKELLASRFLSVKQEFNPDKGKLEDLKKDYLKTIENLGKIESASLTRQLAELEAYYLHNLDSASVLLSRLLEQPLPSEEVEANIKLELADILVAKNEVWDASLLYSQVDKDFKYDKLGFRAKFMNAKISYYTGDFEWAQAQLDVLKGSTSKLISNDAMDLSLLITDNMNMDTILDPMLKFAHADLLIVQNRYSEALSTLDSLNSLYPGHALSDEILFRRAEIAEKKKDYAKAAEFYQQVLAEYYWDIMADNALFRLASLYHEPDQLNDQVKAQELYKQLMVDFPGSLFVVEARKRFRELRGDQPGNNSDNIIERENNPTP